ncbi:hypothetical protein BKA65DRAFT_111462 [Rhexocercosporidium sp. MPI-PUGE-AT-0058]|nr:hypothetical protein BKA65DRAFT_111462 [Rhexocercosporidium sp. MPI-PUGE-AT-0058]
MWAWEFSFFDLGLRKFMAVTQMLCVIAVCILSPVLPYVLKKYYKASHIAGLCFFAMEYVLLFVFYAHVFHVSYCKPKNGRRGDTDKIHDIVMFNMVLSSCAFIVAIPSLVLYAEEVVDFELSLWIKYGVAAVWYVRWVFLQYTSKDNFDLLWFWRWLKCTAARADSGIPSVATNEPLRKGSITFQPTATNANSKTPNFTTNEAPRMGSEVTFPSSAHQDMPSHPLKPNRDNIYLESGHGAGPSPVLERWEAFGDTVGKSPRH